MSCHASGCTAEQNWFRRSVRKWSGYYFESQWYCSEPCLKSEVLRKLEAQPPVRGGSDSPLFQKKLAQSLIASGLLTKEQLAGKGSEPNLTQHLLATGLVSERDITHALSRLHHLPLIKLNNRRIHASAINTVPVEIVTTHQFFPLEFRTKENCLVLVTSNPASVPVMIDLRRLLDCEVEIYLGAESVVKSMIDQYCSLSERTLSEDDTPASAAGSNPRELADCIVRRARATGASELQVERFGDFIWTRFVVDDHSQNLVL
jgi:hypothetical protein